MEWEYIVLCTNALLDSALVSLGFGYMLVTCGYVQLGMEVC